MGQAVKYAALGAAIAVILTLAAAIVNSMYPTEIISNLGTSINSFLSAAGSFLQNVRGALNYFFGSSVYVTIALSMLLIVPFGRIAYKVSIAVFRFINQ